MHEAALNPIGPERARRPVPATVLAAVTAVVVALLASTLDAQGRVDFSQEPACQTLTTTSMGGPAPKHPHLMVWRWLGASNHEMAYRNTVILFNAYYGRVPPARPLGFDASQVTKVDAILVGHGHGDHMADAPDVAKRTGAVLIGGPPTTVQAVAMGLPERQTVTVRGGGGEVRQFNGFTVEAVLARHNVDGDPELGSATGEAYRSVMRAAGLARTPAQEEQARARRQGSRDPRLPEEGTIGFLLTFESGYRMLLRDSSGGDHIQEGSRVAGTEAERRLMQRIGGRVDAAVVAYSTMVPTYTFERQTLPLLRLFRPAIYMPTHHDDSGGGRFDTPTEPLFMAIRDALPDTRGVSPLHRTPVCFDTQTKEVFVGQ